jgi:hypothetical protein
LDSIFRSTDPIPVPIKCHFASSITLWFLVSLRAKSPHKNRFSNVCNVTRHIRIGESLLMLFPKSAGGSHVAIAIGYLRNMNDEVVA